MNSRRQMEERIAMLGLKHTAPVMSGTKTGDSSSQWSCQKLTMYEHEEYIEHRENLIRVMLGGRIPAGSLGILRFFASPVSFARQGWKGRDLAV